MNRRGEPCSDRPISGRALRACCGTARSAGTRCRRHCSSLDAKKKKKKTLTKEFIQSDFPSLPLLLIGGDGRKATQFEKHAHSDPHSGVTCSTFVIVSSLSLSKRGTFFSMGLSFCVPSPDPPDPAQISYLPSMQVCV